MRPSNIIIYIKTQIWQDSTVDYIIIIIYD